MNFARFSFFGSIGLPILLSVSFILKVPHLVLTNYTLCGTLSQMKIKTAEEKERDELNLITLAQEYSSDEKARAFLESKLWPNGAVCPHCKNDGQTKPNSKLEPKAGSKSAVRKGVYFCGACREQFTVTVGTIFEGSHVPLGKWLMAVFILCSSKKSISANQMSRMLKVQYKTAWFMLHRLRHAVTPEMPLNTLLKGTVEVDETFVG